MSTPMSTTMSAKDNLNTFNELTNTGMERITALGEINLKVAERVTARQMDALNLFVEQGVRMMKVTTEAKGYADLYKGQVELTKDITERLAQESKANLQVAAEVRDDYRGWFDAAMADVRASKDVVRNALVA